MIPINFWLDLSVFLVQILIMISSLYSAWVNFFQKRISKFGFDTLILLLFIRPKAELIRANPKLVKRMGIICLLIAIGTLNEAVTIFTQKILLYFR